MGSSEEETLAALRESRDEMLERCRALEMYNAKLQEEKEMWLSWYSRTYRKRVVYLDGEVSRIASLAKASTLTPEQQALQRAKSSGEKLFIEVGCTTQNMHTCTWRCAGSGICQELYHNKTFYAHSSRGFLQKWTTTPCDGGEHVHAFSSTCISPPSMKPPKLFGLPPKCPPLPGPPSEEFMRRALDEDAEWMAWRKEEGDRQKREEEEAAAAKAAKREAKKGAMKQAASRAISGLDCPAKAGFTTKIDEGPEIIARCGGGRGSHTLPLEDLLNVVAKAGLTRTGFQEFVESEKQNFVGTDVNKLVSAYVEIAELPPDPGFEAELEEMDRQASSARQQAHEERTKAQGVMMRNRREEKRSELTRQWQCELLSSDAWQRYLREAEAWVGEAEGLLDAWDAYDQKRREFESELGGSWGFAERPAPPLALPADWSRHPVLQHVAETGPEGLPERWKSLALQGKPQTTATPAPSAPRRVLCGTWS